jgi:hypothetical protein
MGPWSIPLLTARARARAQKVSRIGLASLALFVSGREREREREISGWGTCVRGLNARSACFPRKVQARPAGRHGRAPRSPARCRPCSFSRPQKEHARAPLFLSFTVASTTHGTIYLSPFSNAYDGSPATADGISGSTVSVAPR